MSITATATSARLVEKRINQSLYQSKHPNPPSPDITQVLLLEQVLKKQVLKNPPRNGAELVAYWQREGVINSRPDITDSQAYARQLRHEAETRTKQ